MVGSAVEKKKRGSSAFSSISKQIRTSLSNIFGKSSKIQIMPAAQLDQPTNTYELNKKGR